MRNRLTVAILALVVGGCGLVSDPNYVVYVLNSCSAGIRVAATSSQSLATDATRLQDHWFGIQQGVQTSIATEAVDHTVFIVVANSDGSIASTLSAPVSAVQPSAHVEVAETDCPAK